jgi:hypothetical protein
VIIAGIDSQVSGIGKHVCPVRQLAPVPSGHGILVAQLSIASSILTPQYLLLVSANTVGALVKATLPTTGESLTSSKVTGDGPGAVVAGQVVIPVKHIMELGHSNPPGQAVSNEHLATASV